MFWLLIVVFILIAIFYLSNDDKKKKYKDDDFTYQKISTLFTPAERSFLGVLNDAISSEYAIYGKVRVADVLEVKSTPDKSKYQTAFNKISSKHFDYIVCNKNDLSVLCAIELDDKSHNKSNRIDRDKFLESACNSAKLKLIRFEAKYTYSVQDVREKVLAAIAS